MNPPIHHQTLNHNLFSLPANDVTKRRGKGARGAAALPKLKEKWSTIYTILCSWALMDIILYKQYGKYATSYSFTSSSFPTKKIFYFWSRNHGRGHDISMLPIQCITNKRFQLTMLAALMIFIQWCRLFDLLLRPWLPFQCQRWFFGETYIVIASRILNRR